jgi:hypothetical protein
VPLTYAATRSHSFECPALQSERPYLSAGSSGIRFPPCRGLRNRAQTDRSPLSRRNVEEPSDTPRGNWRSECRFPRHCRNRNASQFWLSRHRSTVTRLL